MSDISFSVTINMRLFDINFPSIILLSNKLSETNIHSYTSYANTPLKYFNLLPTENTTKRCVLLEFSKPPIPNSSIPIC